MSEFKRVEAEMFPGSHATITTKGRQKKQPDDKFRTEFQRDIHRIIYSQSFRRLKHKTQVFYFPQNDHVSTRMDHVLFVASAAKACACLPPWLGEPYRRGEAPAARCWWWHSS